MQDLPKLYRANVLDPLRTPPTQATLDAWDAYSTMMNADVKDSNEWNQTVYPPLQFERACDDYAIAPSTEKLEGLIKIVNAVPTHAQADDWIARIHKLLDDYRAHHGGSAIASESSGPATATTKDPNVTISTEQQGDATIITTHTNTAPVNPAPPAH